MKSKPFWLKLAVWALYRYYRSINHSDGGVTKNVNITGWYDDYRKWNVTVEDRDAGVMS